MEPLPAEQRWIDAFKAGDAAAFAKIMEHYEPYVLGLIWRMTGDRATAEDLCQETFLKILKGLGSFRRGSSLKTWIFRIAHNAVVDHARGTGRAAEPLEESGADICPPDPAPTPLAQVEEGQFRRGIEAAMGTLAPREREILHMLYWDGLSVAEIAAACTLPEGTVKTLLFRARRALRGRVVRDLMEARP
ncbi:MAG: RNA polymerase sigma factor [Acidobacteriota bacterium]